MQTNSANWLKQSLVQTHPSLRLFCIPFAGAGASAFNQWQHLLSADVQLNAIQLPGRENRFAEPPINNMQELISQLEQIVMPYTDEPWAVFGHSMGAAIGYELIRSLEARGCNPPAKFITSAKTPPNIALNHEPIANLPDELLIQVLAERYGADISAGQRELLELMLNTLRADFQLIENYNVDERGSLTTDILALCGSQDNSVSYQQMLGWSEYTKGQFQIEVIEGPHFYLQSARQQLTSLLNQHL
ncbi:alpha/beta fold hydrolase [Aliiglaciecola sp. LCG003]|uniref:thioesterase II family protein n=1 Tax=Aliiglaciecola sp. LCG003 TaxID=3053655 RepID=UPI00257486F2|nr:alpha/beta fold hydrolase [Aliiglaciecola sp. LCG003]WJG09758.1 alpha/beta fold hydrolase [Aliiglaciecola sp. LCG003]